MHLKQFTNLVGRRPVWYVLDQNDRIRAPSRGERRQDDTLRLKVRLGLLNDMRLSQREFHGRITRLRVQDLRLGYTETIRNRRDHSIALDATKYIRLRENKYHGTLA
jgi:hypothetical protein